MSNVSITLLAMLVLAGCGTANAAATKQPARAPEPAAAEVAAPPTPLEPKRAEAEPPPAAPPAEAATPAVEDKSATASPPTDVAPSADSAPAETEGTLISRSGKTLRMKVAPGATPSAGTSGTLLRYFEGKSGQKTPLGALSGLFGGSATISGWIAIAEVRVKKLEGEQVTLEIEKESSKMVVNGKPLNHFTPGARLRLAAKSQ